MKSKHSEIFNKENYKLNDVCQYCQQEFYDRSGKYKHEKKCQFKIKQENDNETLLNKINQIEQEHEIFKKVIQEKLNIDPLELIIKENDTIKSINTQNNINNINNNNCNNTTTINNNNITIIPLGYEKLSDVLTDKEQLYILNCRANGLKELIQLVHISDKSKYNKFKNIMINNLNNTFASTYDTKYKNHISIKKDLLLEDVIEFRMGDLQDFYNKLGDKLDEETNNIITKFITRMNTKGDPLKNQKKEEVKLLFYNNRDKIKRIIKKILAEIEI
jgi:hypothetical protein